MNGETQYLDLLRELLAIEDISDDRTGTGTRRVFGRQMRFDLQQGFPLFTTKKVHWKSIVYELLWFMRGDTNTKYLNDHGVTIWNEWRRPYRLDRELVMVDRREATPSNFSGTISCKGLNSHKGSLEQKLATSWQGMMRRCYNPTYEKFRYYGQKGTTVHPRWHDVTNFVVDAQKLPHWEYKLASWSSFDLDKDYYGANQYGPDTCVWLSKHENITYTDNAVPLRAITVGGEEMTFVSSALAARCLGIPASSLHRFIGHGRLQGLKAGNRKFNGWLFEGLDSDQLLRLALIEDGDLGPIYGKNWRDWDGVDQLTEALNQIKANPTSRRIIVSAWNVTDIPNMALPPCHLLCQFFVDRGRLSCQMYQRSCDMFLGVCYNVASYSLLTHIMADMAGLDVGEFIWVGGDVHLYNNHVKQAELQLSRSARPAPKLIIKDRSEGRPRERFEDWEFEDFELDNYNPYPAIKAPVAV